MKTCEHTLVLRNLGSPTASQIYITPFTPGTLITNASAPATWKQIASYPNSVIWSLKTGTKIPYGSPIPGKFSIFIMDGAQKDKRVLVEWRTDLGKVICQQVLRVGCGIHANFEPATPPAGIEKLLSCRCLSVATAADEDSEEFSEPDLSVEIGAPLAAGFLKVAVPYSIEVEPVTLQFTRQWEVTLEDDFGEEQPIAVPVSDDMSGQATFTLPEAGVYNFYLTVTDPATCLSKDSRDSEEYTDTDFATYILQDVYTEIVLKAVDPCDPRKYEFRDVTEPAGTNPKWTITNEAGVQTKLVAVNAVASYVCPKLDVGYTICLEATDPDTGTARPKACEIFVPSLGSINVGFTYKYGSCVKKDFVATFTNTSTTSNCPISWDWDFGDGTPHSVEANPTHIYADAGSYAVTLTMTVAGVAKSVSTSQSIEIEHWQPDIDYNICPDGVVHFRTSVECQFFREWPWGCHREWTFPGGTFLHFRRRRKSVRVCYESIGVKVASLWGMSSKGGECRTDLRFKIESIDRRCRHDKVKTDWPFSHGGKQYRMRTTFKYHGWPGRIYAKTKLQVKSNNKWRRKRAAQIGVKFSGTVYTKVGDCFDSPRNVKKYNKWTRSMQAKVSNWHFPLKGSFRVGAGKLTSTHMVQVDSKHAGITQTIALWEHDCGCTKR